MAESEKQAAEKEKEEKEREDISKSVYSTKDNISEFNDEQIYDLNYTHPIVCKKKGFINLTNYKKNYQDMESRAKAERSKRQFMEISKDLTNIEERSRNSENISPTFIKEIDAEKYTKESTETIGKITEIHDSDKIDVSNVTKKQGKDVSLENILVEDDEENVSEQTNILPEEAYIQHMERVIASKNLPLRNLEILENLYANYNSDKKKTSTIKSIDTETDVVGCSEPGKSETVRNRKKQIEQVSTSEKEKAILDSSSKDIDNVLHSEMQNVTGNLISTESSISIVKSDNRKLESLENDSLAKKDKILTSTPKTSLDKINFTSNIDNKKNDSCDQNFMTIENPFSDFTLQTIKLQTNLENSIIEESNNLSDISENSSSNLISNSSENVTTLEESKIIQLSPINHLSEKKDTTIECKESVMINLLICSCTDLRTDETNNENNNTDDSINSNNNMSIIERISRYFLF